MAYDESRKKLRLTSLKTRRIKGDLYGNFKILHNDDNGSSDHFSSQAIPTV